MAIQRHRRLWFVRSAFGGPYSWFGVAGAQVAARPDPSGLPGTEKLQQLVNGAYLWVLLLTLGALVVSAVVWAWGSQSNNVRAASDGRRGVGVALLAALIVGAAPMLVNWFYGLGR